MRIVIMGVSGSGKTVVGQALAKRLDTAFLDADQFHPPANVEKMSQGQPLDDADRQPWLERLNRELRQRKNGCVLGCSALKRAYRQTLGRAVDDLRLVHLSASFETIGQRMKGRDHFMPVELLRSQFDTLEPPTADEALIVDASQPVEAIVHQITDELDRAGPL